MIYMVNKDSHDLKSISSYFIKMKIQRIYWFTVFLVSGIHKGKD